MNVDELVERTKALLDEVGQLKSPTARIGSPKVQGWVLGWIAGHASDAPLDRTTLLDEPRVHQAMEALFEGMPNPFGNYQGSLGYTSLVEAKRILDKTARGEALEPVEQVRDEWLAIGHAEALRSRSDDERPARFLALFGR